MTPLRFLKTMIVASLFITTLTASGCEASSERSGISLYIPKTEFTDLESYESNLPRLFSDYLKAANEPVIFDDSSVAFAVRLTIQGAFKGGIVVRVEENRNGDAVAQFKRFGPKRPDNTEPLVEQGEIRLTKNAIMELRKFVAQQGFWAVTNKQEVIGSDGSYWVVEVKDGQKYHVVYRWWPSGGPVFEIGTALLNLAGAHFADR